MTKKTLIELMLENDVKWPDGAEFAAQDKYNLRAYFYSIKPKFTQGGLMWDSYGVVKNLGVDLPGICNNWHQTVVTREQYEAAQVRRNAAKREHPIKIDDSVAFEKWPPRTLDAIFSNIKKCDDKIAHHDTQISAVRVDRDVLIDELNELLACVGMKAVTSSNIKPIGVLNGRLPEMIPPEKWPDYCAEDGIVVDWDRVPVGIEVECVSHRGAYEFEVGKSYTVGFDVNGRFGPIDADGETHIDDCVTPKEWTEFRFIK